MSPDIAKPPRGGYVWAMHRIVLLCLLASASAAWAQDVRWANGAVIKGEVVNATPAGLEMKTAAGLRTLAWETLSIGTRYRHQPGFRARAADALKGAPAPGKK